MILIPLTKQETQELSKVSNNIWSFTENMCDKDYQKCTEMEMLLQIWVHTHKLDVNKIKQKWTKMTELLDTKPAYYMTNEFKNAVWGFKFHLGDGSKNKFIIYLSTRGITVELYPEFEVSHIILLYEELVGLLVNRDDDFYKRTIKDCKQLQKENDVTS